MHIPTHHSKFCGRCSVRLGVFGPLHHHHENTDRGNSFQKNNPHSLYKDSLRKLWMDFNAHVFLQDKKPENIRTELLQLYIFLLKTFDLYFESC